jgi:hypothetical protein
MPYALSQSKPILLLVRFIKSIYLFASDSITGLLIKKVSVSKYITFEI